MMLFNYNHRDSEFDDIIEEARFFAAAQLNGEVVADKEARIKNLNFAIAKYCTAGTRAEAAFAASGLDAMKDPRVHTCGDVLENFNAVIAEIINSILPMVASRDYARYLAEVRQVGWGDTARFVVRSNELYKVNEIAEGVNRGVLQPIYDNEITVNSKKTEVAASIDWYPVAAGVFDWGDFGLRYSRSFEAYLFLKIIAAMTSATSQLGGAYSVAGFSNANWTTMIQRVSAANGGAPVYAIGTLAALNTVYPAAVGLQYGLGEELAKEGYLDKYLGARMIPVDQVMIPGTVNTTADFAIPDDVIYFVAADAYLPIKIVFEGNSSIVERDPDHTPDRTYRIRIQERVGVAAVTGSKFGTMDLQ